MIGMKSFDISYDNDSDVLYISCQHGSASKGIEDPEGVVWRYDKDGNLIGVTIINFQDYWNIKKPELAHEISERFHISANQAEGILVSALANDGGISR